MNSELPLVTLLLLAAAPAGAAELRVAVHDPDGDPLGQAVVVVEAPGAAAATPPRPTATVDQVNRAFDPHVSAVRTGTAINFPNRDDIRHHLYSFSEAKTFELPLYRGTPTEPVVFDQAGIVTLACNIHDWMLAFVYVADSPWLAVTDEDGRVRFTLPEQASYQVTVWHPSLGADNEGLRYDVVGGSETAELAVELEPGAERGSRRLRRGTGRYR